MALRAIEVARVEMERSPILAEMLLNAAAEGVTMAQLCRDLDVPPHYFYNWLASDADFKARYEAARDVGYDRLADQCLEIADDSSGDERQGKFGPTLNGEFVARSKLRVETRLKLLACWNPRKYGQKIDVSSQDGSMKPQTLAEFYAASRAKGDDNGSE